MDIKDLKALMDSMSLEEKVGQMVQVSGGFLEEGAVITGPAADVGLTTEDCLLAGSILGVAGAKRLRSIQDRYMERHPHHIPLLMMSDVIHGFKTVFPIPLALGATFNPELVERDMEIAAREAAAAGLHVSFSPMTDLVRDPRWGRVYESYGESPYLNSVMAKAYVRGYQGEDNDLSKEGRISACDKHFVGYGAPVGGREYNHSEISEHSIREYYLPAKIAAIKAGSACVMPAFQSLNGEPCSASEKIVRGLLRDELKFEGVTISDWSAVGELVNHGVAENNREAAKLAVKAGIDIDLMSVCYIRELKGLVESGEVEERLVDEAVWRILMLKNRLGLFEDPYHGAGEDAERKYILAPKHKDMAEETVAEALVLLKNEDDILPLKREEKVVFIGPYIDSRDTCGSWAIFQDENDTISFKEGMEQKGYTENAEFLKGCEILENSTVLGFGRQETFGLRPDREELMDEAVKAAAKADKAVFLLGEHTLQSGEASSRGDITVPHHQLELLKRVYEVNKNIAVVFYMGRPLVLTEPEKYAKAMIAAFLPGTMGGTGIADVLYGVRTPGGRVPMSFPESVGQIPVYHNEFSTGRPYRKDGAEQKYVSRYLDVPNEPLYPFGYGLGYGKVEYSKVRLSAEHMKKGETIEATVSVKNIGKMEASEKVQLYIHDEKASTVRPVRELKGIMPVRLLPGEEKEVSFTIDEEMLKIIDVNMEFKAEPGRFTVYIGADSRTDNSAGFEFE